MSSLIADSADGPSVDDSPAVDASKILFPPAVDDANAVVDGISGSADTPNDGNVSSDVSPTSDMLDLATRSPAAASSSTSPTSDFPTQQPVRNTRFTNFNEDKFDKGYNSEGGQLFYDPVALDEDWDEFTEDIIRDGPPPASTPAALGKRVRDKKTKQKKQKKSRGNLKQPPEKTKPLSVGENVEAYYIYADGKKGDWFPAVITKVNAPSKSGESSTYNVKYDEDYTDENLPVANIRRVCSDPELPSDKEEEVVSEEEEVVDVLPLENAPESGGSDVPAVATADTICQLTLEDVEKLKGKALDAALAARGMGRGGDKKAKLARLRKAVTDNVPVSAAPLRRHESMNGLDVTAHWELLSPNDEPIPEPINADDRLRPPTEEGRDVINPKYGYDETFERVAFTGTTKNMSYMYTRLKHRKRTGRKLSPTRNSRAPPLKAEERLRGGPNDKFLEKYNLTEHSHPMDFFNAFVPMIPDDNLEDPATANVKGDETTKFSISNWTKYSNMKAQMDNAGEPGHRFAGKFEHFTTQSICRMMGVYVIDGLAPSPQLMQKMQPQSKDRTHGNDFIAKHMGLSYQQHYRQFRAYFGCQDPLMTPPPKEKCPNFKVDEFFRWLRHQWKQAWEVSKTCSVDEQTCCMQGRSEYKTRCGKYKRIGDGIQADCMADDGYTFDFYFRNEPVDQKWLDLGMSPMHARLLHMFGNLTDIGHEPSMDNLFHSVLFSRMSYSIPQKVKVNGVIRKSNRGVPPCVLQEEKSGKAAEAARGTVKAAVLRGDSQSDNLIVASCFDQKPFYMITHSAKEITWLVKTKKVWSSALKGCRL